ncbi:glutathione S-transferase family protein [Methyloraptor flagellatus]|jgi:glutathione S-transferase|uniref:Glutathione S-transferase family protein n=1 Tax=Methyloraptor flagellatus TaxID=3162530 RepID=A0AAU7X8J0_9HYPH
MLKIFHHPFSASSRFVRLMCAEYGVQAEYVVERPWDRRREFLIMNPAGTLPVVVENDGPPICGPMVAMEYIDETRGYAMGDRRLMPNHAETRAEVRRLVEWFLLKFEAEVTGYLVQEKIYKLEMPRGLGGGEPDSTVLRAARSNIRHHLKYVGYLAATRDWLAGPRMTFADLAAAATLSCADYLGEVPWDDDDHARHWYARIKSRPSFRPLLADRILAMPPSSTYADLDF